MRRSQWSPLPAPLPAVSYCHLICVSTACAPPAAAAASARAFGPSDVRIGTCAVVTCPKLRSLFLGVSASHAAGFAQVCPCLSCLEEAAFSWVSPRLTPPVFAQIFLALPPPHVMCMLCVRSCSVAQAFQVTFRSFFYFRVVRAFPNPTSCTRQCWQCSEVIKLWLAQTVRADTRIVPEQKRGRPVLLATARHACIAGYGCIRFATAPRRPQARQA